MIGAARQMIGNHLTGLMLSDGPAEPAVVAEQLIRIGADHGSTGLIETAEAVSEEIAALRREIRENAEDVETRLGLERLMETAVATWLAIRKRIPYQGGAPRLHAIEGRARL